MEEVYVKLNKGNRLKRISEVLIGVMLVVLGITNLVRTSAIGIVDFKTIVGLLFILLGVIKLLYYFSAYSPYSGKYIRLNSSRIVFKVGVFSSEKQISWSDITEVQLNNRMVKVDYNQSRSVELLDFSNADDADLFAFKDFIKALAIEKNIKVV